MRVRRVSDYFLIYDAVMRDATPARLAFCLGRVSDYSFWRSDCVLGYIRSQYAIHILSRFSYGHFGTDSMCDVWMCMFNYEYV
jgi:hypothetical protein